MPSELFLSTDLGFLPSKCKRKDWVPPTGGRQDQSPGSHSASAQGIGEDGPYSGCVTASGDHQATGRLVMWMTLHDARATGELAIPDELSLGGRKAKDPQIRVAVLNFTLDRQYNAIH